MAFALLQKVQAQGTTNVTLLTTGAMTNPTAMGSLLVVNTARGNSSADVTSVTDNNSNAYTKHISLGDAANPNWALNAGIYYNLSISGKTGHTFTVNAGSSGLALGAMEFSHAGTVAASLNHTANGGTGGGTAQNPGAVTPTGGAGVNYLYISAVTNDNTTLATFTANTGAGWAMETNQPGNAAARPSCASSMLISTGAQTGTITASAPSHWVAVVATFSEAASGAVVNSNFLQFM